MIFDSPGPYHYGELAARVGCQGVLGFRFDRVVHMWMASWQAVFDGLIALVGCGHMSGLLVRYRTAGPDDIRQSWSLSLRRARGSCRMSGCPGLSFRPCRSYVDGLLASGF